MNDKHDCDPATIDISRLEKAAELLKAVAHPVRLLVIRMLRDGERSVSDLYQTIGTSQSYMSQQLNLMKAKGVLTSRRNGNQVLYSLTNPKVVEIVHCVCVQEAMNRDSQNGDESSKHEK